MRRQLVPALRMVLVLTLAAGSSYPLAVTGVAQVRLRRPRPTARSSSVNGEGSARSSIGQAFAKTRAPEYFHPARRPPAARLRPVAEPRARTSARRTRASCRTRTSPASTTRARRSRRSRRARHGLPRANGLGRTPSCRSTPSPRPGPGSTRTSRWPTPALQAPRVAERARPAASTRCSRSSTSTPTQTVARVPRREPASTCSSSTWRSTAR